MSRFDFALKYVAGKSIRKADSLSRKVDWAEEVKRGNENQVMLKKEWLEIKAIERGQVLIERAEEEIVEKIKKLEVRDNKVIKAVEKMKKSRSKSIKK